MSWCYFDLTWQHLVWSIISVFFFLNNFFLYFFFRFFVDKFESDDTKHNSRLFYWVSLSRTTSILWDLCRWASIQFLMTVWLWLIIDKDDTEDYIMDDGEWFMIVEWYFDRNYEVRICFFFFLVKLLLLPDDTNCWIFEILRLFETFQNKF